jgi:hypothetical protein
MALRKNSDAGTPLATWDVPAMGRQLDAMAQALAGQVSIASMRGQFVQPTISVR